MDSVRGTCDAERARRPAWDLEEVLVMLSEPGGRCVLLGMLRCTSVRCLSQITFVPDKFDPWDLNRA